MTSYRTIVPGMNEAQAVSDNTVVAQPQIPNYGAEERGTQIPNMNQSQAGAQSNYTSQQEGYAEKPLVGFLVSVSRTEVGEYWVLRQGQNTIGSADNCDIKLSESSISGLHAVLAIHRNPQDQNKLNVGIMDKGSSNGVFVNGDYIGFNPYQCKSLDKIKIGGYEFLLMLFDALEYGMSKSANFVSRENVDNGGMSAPYGDYSSRDVYPDPVGEGTKF